MTPIRRNKRMKKERSNVGCGDLTCLSFVNWYAEFIKRIAGPLSPSVDNRFELFFKMSIKTFKYVCSLVMEPMSKSQNYKFEDRREMSLYDKVAIAIRRLESGNSLESIGQEFGAHSLTASKVTWSFVEALEENGLRHLQWPATEEEMACIKARLEGWKIAPRALDRLKEEWKVLQKEMWKPDKLPSMIRACCILHIIVIDMNDEKHHELSLSQDHDLGYLQEIAESINETSTDLREKLSLYLSAKLEHRVERASEYQTL